MAFSRVFFALVAALLLLAANGRELRQASPTFVSDVATTIVGAAANLVDGAIDFAEDVTDFFGATPEAEAAIADARETAANNTATATEFISNLG